MDKNTLSNYGWIVIAVLVLSVMIALATPFGQYIESGFKSTYTGFFNVNKNALEIVDVVIDEQDSDESTINKPINDFIPGLYETGAIAKYKTDGANAIADMLIAPLDDMIDIGAIEIINGTLNHSPSSMPSYYIAAPSCALEGDLLLPQDGSITAIADYAFLDCYGLTGILLPIGLTDIGSDAFNGPHINSIVIPKTVTHFGALAFSTTYLESITFEGTVAQWNAIIKDMYEKYPWNYGVSATYVQCSDGKVAI